MVYITIDKKWLIKNIDRLEKEYEEDTGEKGYIKIYNDEANIRIEEVTDNAINILISDEKISVSEEIDIDIETLIELLKYWVKKLEAIQSIIKK